MVFWFVIALLCLEYSQVEENGLTLNQFAGRLASLRGGIEWFQSWLWLYFKVQSPFLSWTARLGVPWRVNICNNCCDLVLPLDLFLLLLISLHWITSTTSNWVSRLCFLISCLFGSFTFFCCTTCRRWRSELRYYSLLFFSMEIRAIPMGTWISFFLIRWARHGFECEWVEHDFVLSVGWPTLISKRTLLSLAYIMLLFWLLSHRGCARYWHINQISVLPVEDWSAEILRIMTEPAGVLTKTDFRWNVYTIPAHLLRR